VSVDVTKLRKGTKIKVGPRTLEVRGFYMSSTGLVVTAKEGGMAVDQNIPFEKIDEIKES
jgi:hypothetical protein